MSIRRLLRPRAVAAGETCRRTAEGGQDEEEHAVAEPGASRKSVTRIDPPPPRHWVGDGFPVRTMFSYDGDAAATSPFLLLDYAAPMELPPTQARRGVGEHPHRGFETVTVVYQGEVEHRDSAGNRGKIGPGDVQWMTAASGVLHEEFHAEAFSRRGGVIEMAQVWVNLPAKFKMSPPRYQDILDRQIPAAALPGGAGRVRVIAGECMGVRGPARTFTPVEMWDVRLAKDGGADFVVPEGSTTMLLVTRGALRVNDDTPVAEGRLAHLGRHGTTFRLHAQSDATALVLGGEPIDEPVVGQGPFVMNTREEIVQAARDFRSGRFGRLS
jgi:redox-sensitive bicupin YhaK (pirin superfamily)